MQRMKRRTYSGSVLEQEVYTMERVRSGGSYAPRPRFKTDEERQAHRIAISRRRHERLVNENFSPSSYYVTLTFDDANECHDYAEAKKLRDRYCRRIKRKYPDAVMFVYMGRGRNTNRIHLHMLIDGVPDTEILKQWSYGSVKDCKHLRSHNYYEGVDHGQDYSSLANYLFDHWEPEQGSHRWKQTRNARQPEREEAQPVKRCYSESRPPKAPKGYILVQVLATKYGYYNFKYVRIPEKDNPCRTTRKVLEELPRVVYEE